MALDTIRKLLEPDQRLVEEVVEANEEWKGKIFDVAHLQVELSDKSRDWREVVFHNGGAGVCVVKDQKMCLVRQYRVAIGRMTLEIPAGKIDKGEDPAVCAARELREETGIVAGRMEFLANSNGAPGFTNEKTRVFVAKDITMEESAPDEGEFVDVVWLPVEDVIEAIRAGLIEDSKTVVSAFAVAAGLAG